MRASHSARAGLSVNQKLFAILSAMGLAVLALVAVYVQSYRQSGAELDLLLHVYNKKLDIGSQVEQATTEMQGAQRGLMLSYAMKDPGAAGQYLKLYDDSARRISAALEEFRPLLSTSAERGAFNDIAASLNAWKPRFKDLESLCESGDIAAAYNLRNQNKVISAKMHARASELVAEQRKTMRALEAEEAASRQISNWIAGLVVAFTLALGAVISVVIRKVGSQFRRSILEIHKGADRVALGAGQISTSSQALAQGASSQAASLRQTVASSGDIAAISRKNVESSRNAAQFMRDMDQSVATANAKLANMTARMEEIGESSGKISKIIKVIDGIAFQTTILALNAAVEAARAGEAGLGFAVVADEVGKLALRSAQAAKDTAALIADSITKSGEGSKQLGEVAESIHAITESAGRVKTLVDAVDASSKAQAKGIEEISRAVSQIDIVTQQTAASAQQSAAASQDLNSQSQALTAIVGQLQTLVGVDQAALFPGDDSLRDARRRAGRTAPSLA